MALLLWNLSTLGKTEEARKKAIKAFTEAIKLQPKDPSLYLQRGWVWGRLRDRNNALKDLDMTISLNPSDSDPYVARAVVWQTFRKFKGSKQDFATAIRLSPKDPTPYYYRMSLWRDLGNEANEIKDFATAIRLDPKPKADMCVRLGILYHRKRKYSLAFEQYNRAMDLKPKVALPVDRAQMNIFNAIASLGDGRWP